MTSTTNIIAVLAFAAAASAQSTGVCQNVDATFRGIQNECESVGCVFTGSRCRQPAACTDDGYVEYLGERTGLRATRKPIAPEVARLCDSDNDCSAMYVVDLQPRWTTGPPNCNDMAMLPPHGANQSECKEIKPELFSDAVRRQRSDWNSNTRPLQDYIGHPFKNDGVKQSVAASKNSVTAITEDTDDCFESNQNCAFPLGFWSDTIRKGFKICVKVTHARDKWIEIMGASKSGSDASFCVRDRNKDENVDGDKGCTKAGDLVDIRESGQSIGTDDMFIEFFTEDNFDDANIDFQWRVAASIMTNMDPTKDKDGEDWAQYRDGADYPMSLMKPYPEGYEGDAVFETDSDSSASWVSPSAFMVLVAVLAAALM
jgi:hypothetical protein